METREQFEARYTACMRENGSMRFEFGETALALPCTCNDYEGELHWARVDNTPQSIADHWDHETVLAELRHMGDRENTERRPDMDASREMPKYRSHKEVWALKIACVEPATGERATQPNEETDGGGIITPEEEGYAQFRVEADYMRKHQPQAGGYFVVYKDGYKSWSPAKAFEEGYKEIF